MHFIEILYRIATLFFVVILSCSFIYGYYSIYYAYFKKKDERQKQIVTKSMANALTLLIIYYLIQLVVLLSNNPVLYHIWDLLQFGFDSTTPLGYISISLGFCLFINKRKAGKV